MNKMIILISILFLSFSSNAQNDKDRAYWIHQYLSVSYPLKHIHITSPFGWRTNPITKKGREFHKGLDLRASIGTDVYAMMDGVVVKVSSDKRSGKYVTIKHDDITVSYCHLSKQLVKMGDKLCSGDIVGLSGNTGRALKGGPHLHITLKYKGEVVDPFLLMDYIKSVKSDAIANLLRSCFEF